MVMAATITEAVASTAKATRTRFGPSIHPFLYFLLGSLMEIEIYLFPAIRALFWNLE